MAYATIGHSEVVISLLLLQPMEEDGTFGELNEILQNMLRKQYEKKTSPSVGLIDSQNVTTTCVCLFFFILSHTVRFTTYLFIIRLSHQK
jgi:hypothetical protein